MNEREISVINEMGMFNYLKQAGSSMSHSEILEVAKAYAYVAGEKAVLNLLAPQGVYYVGVVEINVCGDIVASESPCNKNFDDYMSALEYFKWLDISVVGLYSDTQTSHYVITLTNETGEVFEERKMDI